MLRIDLSLFYALLHLKGMPVCEKNVRVAAKKSVFFQAVMNLVTKHIVGNVMMRVNL